MDFFGQQEQARRQTRTLVWLFVLAVLAIVGSVNLALALIWIVSTGHPLAGAHTYPAGFFATNTVVTLALIGGGTLIQSWNLRDGGDTVARMAGGRLLPTTTRDLRERRLLNVVAEMALASGIASPKIYVLDREPAINAFAAGHNPNEAVIAVTAGALQRLNRDELQGVVAHEFSHIMNGDMRLNIRLIGVLFGIQMIAGFGQTLFQFGASVWGQRGRDDNKGPSGQVILLVVGGTLFMIGYIGIFFGRLIKSAVSRQREFLADASAVQFTRNADGIGGALRKIGGLSRGGGLGSRIEHRNAEQLSHLFLGAARPRLMDGWLATHPPLTERLRKIYGRYVELLDAPEITEEIMAADPMLPDLPYFTSNLNAVAALDAASGSSALPLNALTGAAIRPLPTAVSSGDGEHPAAACRLPIALDNALREPEAACALVYALLLGTEAESLTPMALLTARQPRQAELARYLLPVLQQLPPSARLPLLDLAAPALRQLSAAQRTTLLTTAEQLIAADQRITLAEFVLQTVLQRRLDPHAGRLVPARFSGLSELRGEIVLSLSLVAHVAARSGTETAGNLQPAPNLGSELLSATKLQPSLPSSPPSAMALAAQNFWRGAQRCPELSLREQDLVAAPSINFSAVRAALERANQLAPLAKPALVKVWLAAASIEGGALAPPCADILRALCAAIEAPIPPLVAASYSAISGAEG